MSSSTNMEMEYIVVPKSQLGCNSLLGDLKMFRFWRWGMGRTEMKSPSKYNSSGHFFINHHGDHWTFQFFKWHIFCYYIKKV